MRSRKHWHVHLHRKSSASGRGGSDCRMLMHTPTQACPKHKEPKITVPPCQHPVQCAANAPGDANAQYKEIIKP